MTLPPLNLSFQKSQDSNSRLSQDGSAWSFDKNGWTINLSGSGQSAQSASSNSMLLWMALAAATAYLVLKK